MNGYDLKRLDPREFENLCADIIEKETRQRVERFTVGRDGGVDGRFWVGGNKSAIIQAKHYPDARASRIISAVESEVLKVQKVKPERYIFMTSGKLTPAAKTKIQALLPEYIKTPTDIWGIDEIQSFLLKRKNFAIVQKYTQLYIYSETILKNVFGESMTNALLGGVIGRSDYLLENVRKSSSKFVYTEDYDNALKILSEKNLVVITGEAGIGKTTLSDMLAFACVKKGYSFCSIKNIGEAESIASRNTKDKIVFYFDDFLGENFMNILKGDDSSQVMLFMERVTRSKKLKFILNSRTTIVNKAMHFFPSLEKKNIKANEYMLQIENLKPIDKARILYKHMYFSTLDRDYLDEIYLEKKYWKIINHDNFNPRIIEYILNKERVEFAKIPSEDYFTYVQERLDNPSDIWKDYFDVIDICTKTLVLLVAFNNGRINESHLRDSFLAYCEANGLSSKDESDFKYVIKVAISSLLTRNGTFQSDDCEYKLFNPSLGDYIIEEYFKHNKSDTKKLLFALSNVSSVQYLESLERNKYITPSEFMSLQKALFNELYEDKVDGEEWDWLIEVIYSEVKNLDDKKVVGALSQLVVMNTEDAQNLILNDFYKLYSVLAYFEQVVPEKYDFLWAYLNDNTDSNDFESMFRYLNENQIFDSNLLERLAELYENHILQNIDDHLDIDYTKYVEFNGEDDYDVDSYSIRSEIKEAINANFLDSDVNQILNMTSFDVGSIVDRMDDDYVEKAKEMLKDNAKELDDQDRYKDGLGASGQEEIDELFKRD